MYSKDLNIDTVNAARKRLFTSGRQIQNIPPTRDALVQHIKRAIFQAAYIWGEMFVRMPEMPSPANWGWQRNSDSGPWSPLWITLSEAAKACRELLKCQCKNLKCVSGRCTCKKTMFLVPRYVFALVFVINSGNFTITHSDTLRYGTFCALLK